MGLWGTRYRQCLLTRLGLFSGLFTPDIPPIHHLVSVFGRWWIEISRWWWWRSLIFCEVLRMHELWAVDLVSAIQHHLPFDVHCCCCRSDDQDDENQFWSSNMMIIILWFQDSGVWCYGRMTHRRNYYIAIIIRLFQAPGISPQMESCSQIRPLKDFSHSTREKKFYRWMTY